MKRSIIVYALLSYAVLGCGAEAKPANSPEGEHSSVEEKAESSEAEASEELRRAVGASKVSLGQGLKAAEARGRPISAKFELEDGKLQLSVYTEKAGVFAEVVVDHHTGSLAGGEAITQGEDFEAAQAQSKIMSDSKASLMTAVGKAQAANDGYQVLSVFPVVADGNKAAKVTLVKGEELKTVFEPIL